MAARLALTVRMAVFSDSAVIETPVSFDCRFETLVFRFEKVLCRFLF
jgi:hypothetical protein